MNKKVLAATLPLLGGAVIVGAGFSAWAFNEPNNIKASVSGSIAVTDLIGDFSARIWAQYNTLEHDTTDPAPNPVYDYHELTSTVAGTKTFELELDQGTLYNTDQTAGISMKVRPDTTVTTKYKVTGLVVEIYYDETTYPFVSETSTANSLANDGYHLDLSNMGISWSNRDSSPLKPYLNASFGSALSQNNITTEPTSVTFEHPLAEGDTDSIVGLRETLTDDDANKTLVWQNNTLITPAWTYWGTVSSTSWSSTVWPDTPTAGSESTEWSSTMVDSSTSGKPDNESDYDAMKSAASAATNGAGIELTFTGTGVWHSESNH